MWCATACAGILYCVGAPYVVSHSSLQRASVAMTLTMLVCLMAVSLATALPYWGPRPNLLMGLRTADTRSVFYGVSWGDSKQLPL